MGKYLYGIINSEQRESFGTVGVGGSEIYSVQFEDLGAVVSDVVEDYKITETGIGIMVQGTLA